MNSSNLNQKPVSQEEVRDERDIRNRQQQKRRWYELKVMDARIILATIGGITIASAFLLGVEPLLKLILVVLGLFLIYKGRYY